MDNKKVTNANRIYWLDNLRTFMIFLVVVIHVATGYEKYAMGADWWIVVDPATNDLPGIVFLVLNIFVMATIFFISGFFAPLSLKSKSNWDFIKSKFKRLMIPWTIAVLTLIPLYKVIFLYSRNLPQEHWTTYFHWSSIWSQNWLWFLPVLFTFYILYLLLSKYTSKISLKISLWAVFILSVLYAFFMDFFGLHGWTKIIVLDFQNERLLIYFLLFLLGAQFYNFKTFENERKNKKLSTLIHCTGWIPINLYIFQLIFALIYPGSYIISKAVDTLILRLNFVLSLAYLIFAMVTLFRRFFKKQGKLSKELSRNSYSVYIIHVIVMGTIALTMLNTSIPSLLKFLILTTATYAISNAIVSLYTYIKAKIT